MMEFSSPLAAMHPPPRPAWVNCRDMPASRPMFSGAQTYGANSFNFRDLSMKKPSTDYFTMKAPVRGSSPTASLAADLSTNFHIDKSPQLPTPRRSLFTTNLFAPRSAMEHLTTPPVDYEGATTPPIPSSSPGIDMMDVSPLPHKAPCFVARVTLPSPSPEPTPSDDYMLVHQSGGHTLGVPGHETMFPVQPPVQPQPRRSLHRPSLSRNKAYSTTSVPQKERTPLPTFKFGNGVSGLSCSSTPTLVEAFTESPMEEATPTPFTMNLMPPPSRRTSLSAQGRSNGSPMGQVKKAAPRPRKQFRRSHSMFEHPGDVMKQDSPDYEPPPSLGSVMDIDEPYKQKLPHFVSESEPDSLPRIHQDTMINVLKGEYNAHYDKIVVVDCRFEYEYNGGHIDGAVNYNDKELLAQRLFDEASSTPNTLLILHCEYSIHRAPLMAKFVRNKDRAVNDFQYPKLTYPEMYILEGGYSKFFSNHRTMCFPQNYVEMENKDHEYDCEKGLAKVKQRVKLNRAQTFAFGQQFCQMEDSPTAVSRLGPRSNSMIAASPDHSFSPLGNFARRMASY